jgi:hypothetical protein
VWATKINRQERTPTSESIRIRQIDWTIRVYLYGNDAAAAATNRKNPHTNPTQRLNLLTQRVVCLQGTAAATTMPQSTS